MSNRQMIYIMALLGGILGVISYCQIAFAAINLHDGEWEIAISMQGDKPEKTTDCITKDNLIKKEEEGCKTEQKVVGSTYSMHRICDKKGDRPENDVHMDMHMKETFAGDKMKGTMDLTVTKGQLVTTSMTGTLTGRRIGACKAKSKESQK